MILSFFKMFEISIGNMYSKHSNLALIICVYLITLCSLSECVSFSNIPEATQKLFIDSIDVFLHHVGNTYTPSSMLENAAPDDQSPAAEDCGMLLPSKIEIAPTATAAYTLQVEIHLNV